MHFAHPVDACIMWNNSFLLDAFCWFVCCLLYSYYNIHCDFPGAVFIRFENVWPLVRIYRGGFLLIQFIFLLGINTYGWRQAGVNHVLIFEINPRNNLSHQHLFEVRVREFMDTTLER